MTEAHDNRYAAKPEQGHDEHVDPQEPEEYEQRLLAAVGGKDRFNFLWKQLAGDDGLWTLWKLAKVGLDAAQRDVWLSNALDGCRLLVAYGRQRNAEITQAEMSVLNTRLKLLSGGEVVWLLAWTAFHAPDNGWDALRSMADGVMLLNESTELAIANWQDAFAQEPPEWRRKLLRSLDEAFATSVGKQTREQLWLLIQACVRPH